MDYVEKVISDLRTRRLIESDLVFQEFDFTSSALNQEIDFGAVFLIVYWQVENSNKTNMRTLDLYFKRRGQFITQFFGQGSAVRLEGQSGFIIADSVSLTFTSADKMRFKFIGYKFYLNKDNA